MATMRAVQVPSAGADFELVEREIPTPGPGEAVVRVHACGVCHSDSFAKSGSYPGVSHPLVPGHEIAGEVVGARRRCAGLGGRPAGRRRLVWRQLRLLRVVPPRLADRLREHGDPGRHARRRLRRLRARAGQRDGLDARRPRRRGRRPAAVRRHHHVQRACAQRRSRGDRVAILGVGGLGHLGVQFARHTGL